MHHILLWCYINFLDLITVLYKLSGYISVYVSNNCGRAKVTKANITATNGVVYMIDNIIGYIVNDLYMNIQRDNGITYATGNKQRHLFTTAFRIYSFIHSPIHSFIHSPIHSFAPHIRSFVNYLPVINQFHSSFSN